MLYAILCYDSEDAVCAWPKDKHAAVMSRLHAVEDRLSAQGRLGPVAQLMPTTAATTIRKGGEPVVLDGPFAETKEQLLGFFIVDCENLEHAIETAKELARANASGGSYEIRPVSTFKPNAAVAAGVAG
ncbi:YciI family protein [Thalassobaculum sp.]|uniref:YciI family protein n=1 Tax=Thalassobaculum sp. TaxID=2022740 RepID=UPI0032EF4296